MATRELKQDIITEALSRAGFSIVFDGDNVRVEPSHIRVKHMRIKTVRRGRYISDPALCPPELASKNIIWIDEPPEAFATTENGEEIPIHFSPDDSGEFVFLEHEDIHPDAN